MEMKDIIGHKIKLPKANGQTITVKDDSGKTLGMVRGVNSFNNCRTNLQTKIWKYAKSAGCELDKLFYIDGKWWYINDLKWESDYFKYFEGKDEGMDKRYQDRRDIYDALVNENIMEVIDCWILR